MADDVYSYDSAVARDAEGNLGQTLTAIEGHLQDLTGFVNSVCANWTGDEKEIYQGIQAQWDKAAATVKEILGSVKTTLGSTTESVEGMRGQVRSTLQA
jgi:WXG100 family type VII secretion target